MSEEKDFKYSTKDLDKLIRALENSMPNARVGVLGQSDARKGKAPSNATIGSYHEFGTEKLPQRSFLRVPITEYLQKRMEESGAFDKAALKKVIKDGSLMPWLKAITVLAEGIVLEAFDTGGFGKWPTSNMALKTNHQTLVETHQLRDSITSEVTE